MVSKAAALVEAMVVSVASMHMVVIAGIRTGPITATAIPITTPIVIMGVNASPRV